MSTFHLFPQLPVELRLAIWRKCLPHRASEIDIPLDKIVFELELKAVAVQPLEDDIHERAPARHLSRMSRVTRGSL